MKTNSRCFSKIKPGDKVEMALSRNDSFLLIDDSSTSIHSTRIYEVISFAKEVYSISGGVKLSIYPYKIVKIIKCQSSK